MRRSPEKMKELGNRLKEARQEAGLSRREVEVELKRRGILKGEARTANLSRWETGLMMPDLQVIQTYAELTEKPEEWFLGGATAEDMAEEATAAVVRIFSDIMAGQPPDKSYTGEFGTEGSLHPFVLAVIHQAGDTARAAICQWLQQTRGLSWEQVDPAEREAVLRAFVRRIEQGPDPRAPR